MIDLALRVTPPKGGEIPLEKIRGLIYQLKSAGLNIHAVSADQFQSADMLQQLGLQGFGTKKFSLDRSPTGYDILKSTIYDGRLQLPNQNTLLKELLGLERNARTGKIDHPPHGSKDISDALAGVVYNLTMERRVWHDHGVIPEEVAPKFIGGLIEKKNSDAKIEEAWDAA